MFQIAFDCTPPYSRTLVPDPSTAYPKANKKALTLGLISNLVFELAVVVDEEGLVGNAQHEAHLPASQFMHSDCSF